MQERQWEQSCEEDGPKHFQCFCDKIYPSYSGVYLHLKYKHSEIFTKCQLDNIINYFQKKENNPGKNIYRLQNMPGLKENKKVKEDKEKDKQKDKERQKEKEKEKEKQKEKTEDEGKKDRRKGLRPRREKKKKSEENQDNVEQQDILKDKQVHNHKDHENEDRRESGAKQQSNEDRDDDVIIIQKVVEKKEEFEPPSNNRQQPGVYRSHYPYPPMPYPYAGNAPNFSSINNVGVEDFPFHPIGFKPSFRQILEQCLAEVETQRRQIIQEFRQILYGLMHYIDKNFQKLEDSRVGNKILLSYCGIFSGELVAPLIKQYSDKLKANWRDGNHIVSELCLGRILFWFKVKGYTQPQIRPHTQPTP